MPEWLIFMMNKEKYTLVILKDRFLKDRFFISKGLLKKYNLKKTYSNEYLLKTDSKSELKIYMDLIGIKTIKSYQTTNLSGYIFYE